MNTIESRLQSFVKPSSVASQITLALLASIGLALCANLRIYLPFTPVPFVMQNTILLFFAAGLGRWGGLTMAIAFLVQGMAGFSVFSSGAVGFAAFTGPNGGYLIGYAIAAFIVGALQEKMAIRTTKSLFLHMLIGGGVVYFFGALYLGWILGSFQRALLLGVIPFILTDLLKTATLTTLYSVSFKN